MCARAVRACVRARALPWLQMSVQSPGTFAYLFQNRPRKTFHRHLPEISVTFPKKTYLELLKDMFVADQLRDLADYIQAALMLRYN